MMTTYGRPLRFGYCLNASAADPTRPLRLAQLAETLGLDCVGIQGDGTRGQLELWTLVTAIGMTTSRISIFPYLTQVPLRSPALLAKAAASLDLLTDGRVELALGAKADWGSGTKDMDEAIQSMRQAWREEGPAHSIGIWLGGSDGDTASLAGRLADGWIIQEASAGHSGDLAAHAKRIDQAAQAAGRDPAAIRRIWAISGTIGSVQGIKPFQGSAEDWASSLANYAQQSGIDTILLIEGENAEDQLHRFANEVVGRTRQLIDQAAGVPADSGLAMANQGANASGATPAEEEVGEVDEVDEVSMESFPASDPPSTSSTT